MTILRWNYSGRITRSVESVAYDANDNSRNEYLDLLFPESLIWVSSRQEYFEYLDSNVTFETMIYQKI